LIFNNASIVKAIVKMLTEAEGAHLYL